MSTMKRLSLKGAALLLVIAVMVLAGQASFPEPAAACMWGVTFTDYYSTGGVCYTDCPNTRVCYGDISGYITQSYMGECWYCG